MKVIKEKTCFGTDVILDEEDKFLRIRCGGDGDLYWSVNNKQADENTMALNSFTITKENYDVYSLFEKLFDDMETINIFDEEDLNSSPDEVEEEKKKYHQSNQSHYNELFDPESRTITWYSDETDHKVSNYLVIKQEDDAFRLDFHTQYPLEGYHEDFRSEYHIPIRFKNTGSFYEPLNMIFMIMYYDLIETDDIKDEGHQIHMEEYLYDINKKLVKKQDSCQMYETN